MPLGCHQRVIVMRHSRRADKDGENWDQMSVRTWDPPLSRMGRNLADSQALKISDIVRDVEMIISSPFLRCLQTAHSIRIATRATSECLTVDLGLSELYDYMNSIRYVDSPDICQEGCYRNMSCWFFKFKRRMLVSSIPVNRLCGSTTILQQLQKYVGNDYEDVKVVGKFPSFERYLTLPFINSRYYDSFQNATSRCDGNMIFVTHMSGVTSIINSLFGRIKYYVRPCDYFVIDRHRDSANGLWGKWKLVFC